MIKFYKDHDAALSVLKEKTVAVIGYGAQGRAQALCMKDSGLNVIIGARKQGKSFETAKKDGLETAAISEASEKADIIHILLPDEVQADVYKKEIEPYLKKGKTLSFSHGFSIVFKTIIPPKNVDVIMVAPNSPGTELRKEYIKGTGVVGLIAIKQDYTGNAKQTALAMAKACNLTKIGVLEATFEQETNTDLFAEQAILCGGVSELIKAGFETLTEAGYPPEMAYMVCLHELKLVVDIIHEGGLTHLWDVASNTAEYGGLTRGKKIVTQETKKNMKAMLKEIESGKFAKEWIEELNKNCPNLKKLRQREAEHQIEKTGKEIRAFLKKKNK